MSQVKRHATPTDLYGALHIDRLAICRARCGRIEYLDVSDIDVDETGIQGVVTAMCDLLGSPRFAICRARVVRELGGAPSLEEIEECLRSAKPPER